MGQSLDGSRRGTSLGMGQILDGSRRGTSLGMGQILDGSRRGTSLGMGKMLDGSRRGTSPRPTVGFARDHAHSAMGDNPDRWERAALVGKGGSRHGGLPTAHRPSGGVRESSDLAAPRALHRVELMQNWQRAQAHLPMAGIAPLD